MADLNELSAQEIGRRLRIARENADVRQDDAAHVIGISRPTLVSIEKGVRRVRIQEIQTLARHYGVSVNALLRREAVHLPVPGDQLRHPRVSPPCLGIQLTH